MYSLEVFDFLFLFFPLFLGGVFGVVVFRKNLILVIISLEIMLFAVNINFITFSIFLDDLLGQLFGLFILTVAAAEASIGLAFLVVFYRNTGVLSTDSLSELKG